MSVLIKGMEMPNNCDECWALDEYGDYPMCRITQEQRGYNFRVREKRMDKCPLIPVPPHGDLIDRDALTFSRIRIAHPDGIIGGYNAVVMSAEINNAPTIIPAEEAKDEAPTGPYDLLYEEGGANTT